MANHDNTNSITILHRPFSSDGFNSAIEDLIREQECSDQGLFIEKEHIPYLSDYLEKLGAKTIIAEKYYFDRDMLKDNWLFTPDSVCTRQY